MWQPIRIKFQNLFSHKDTEYFFKRDKCVMIYGRNLTDSDKDSNGGGKSTIMEAITLAITNETSRDVTKDDFINEEEKESLVEFELENKIGNINHLIIRRWFFRNKSTKIELVENGEINREMTSVNECNSRIYELIGLNKSDLIHFYLIGQDTNYSFLTTNDAEKKSIISRLINASFIDSKIDLLKKLSKQKVSERSELETDKTKIESRLEMIDESISDLKENFDRRKKKKIEEIEEEIISLTKELNDNKKELLQIQEKQKEISLKIKTNKFDEEKLSKLKSENRILEKTIDENNRKLRKNKSEISTLNQIKEGAIQCPKCSHKFLLDSNTSLSEIPKKISEIQSENEVLSKSNESIEKEIEKIEKEIEKIEAFEEKLNSYKKAERKNKLKIEELEDDIQLNEKKILSREKAKKEEKAKSLKNEISELELSKTEWIEALELISEEVDKVNKEIEDYEFWIVNFGKKGFTTFLVNKAIKSIEGITNSFLKKINSNCQININGHTILKSGDVNEKISIDVIEDGFRKGNYLKYSGGEKGRINLANIFGLQHLMNLTCPSGGLNLLTLDEVFEGLDQKGQIEIIRVLEKINITSLVVTHRSQPIGAENEIFVEKIDRISRIV